MKRNEIKRGEIVAYQHRDYGHPSPAAVVDTESLWTRTNSYSSTTYSRESGWKCGRDRLYRRTTGWLVVHASVYGDAQYEAALTLLREWLVTVPDVIDAEFVAQAANNMPEGLTLNIEANRYLHGPWEAAKAAAVAAREAKNEEYRREADEAQRQRSLTEAINEELKSRGVGDNAVRCGDGRAHVELSTLAQMLGIESEEVSR